eukprot:4539253-Pyramimonas_sp.AAC.1
MDVARATARSNTRRTTCGATRASPGATSRTFCPPSRRPPAELKGGRPLEGWPPRRTGSPPSPPRRRRTPRTN